MPASMPSHRKRNCRFLSDSKVRSRAFFNPFPELSTPAEVPASTGVFMPEGVEVRDPRSGGEASSVDEVLCPEFGSEAAIYPRSQD